MKHIALSSGLVALVDDEDFAYLNQFSWYADKGEWTVYAKTDQLPNRPRMHVVIMKPEGKNIVHHINGIGTHNCKTNLRIATQSVNARFSALRYSKRGSKYRGVYLHKQSNKYIAEITVQYKKYYIGSFLTQEEAALAYNRKAQELLGDDYIPNVVESQQ